jgi:hypothetical protein
VVEPNEVCRRDCWVPNALPPVRQPDRLAVRTAEEHILRLLASCLSDQVIDQ